MAAPLLVLAGLGIGGFLLSQMSKNAKPRVSDGTIAQGKHLPNEAFAALSSPDAGVLSGARAFTDPYAEIGFVKLLRYKITARTTRVPPGGGGAVEVVQASLTFRKKIAEGGLPQFVNETALGVARTSTLGDNGPSGPNAAAGSMALATVPNGIPASALTFRTVMDDLRLFPDNVTLVLGDPQVLRTLCVFGSPTAMVASLGVPPDLAVLARSLAGLKDFPDTTAALISSMAGS